MGSITRKKLNVKDEKEARSKPNRLMFTDLALRNLKPPASGQVLYWDEVQKGLSLLVSSGGTKTFRSQYKLHGKWLTRTIGRLAENTTDRGENFSVRAARDQCLTDRAKANAGKDPATASDASLTVLKAIEEFVTKYCKVNQHTWDQTEGALTRACVDWLDRPVVSISPDDLYALTDGLIAEGKIASAHQAHNHIKGLWNWLAERNKIPINPLMAVRLRAPKPRRERVYSDDEVRGIWRAAGKLSNEECAYIRVMVLLSPRKTALALMKWTNIVDDVWTTPIDLVKQRKTAKPKVYKTPLPALAKSIVDDLPRVHERVFPSLKIYNSKGERPSYINADTIRFLRRNGAPKDFTLHCLRHTMATWLEDQGYLKAEIGLVLNHTDASTTATYTHSPAIKRKRALYELWEQHVLTLVAAPRFMVRPRLRERVPENVG